MNEKNFEYLSDQLKYTGFGEALQIELKEKMKQQEPCFILYHEAYHEDRVARATLTFNKAKDSDMYFFNSYKVELQKENITDAVEQTFYMGKGSNITMKESYNLLMGRAVNKDLTNKEGAPYNAWLLIDFKQGDENGFKLKQYHQNYGYDLLETLGKYPIKELENETFQKDLIRSLQRGNLQEVTFLKEDKHIKLLIEANPQFKTIGIYDESMKKMDNRNYKDVKQIEVVYEQVGETKKKIEHHENNQNELPKQTSNRRQKRSNPL